MLTIAVLGLLLSFGAGQLVRRAVQRSHLWPVACVLALVPIIIIAVSMPFATQGVAWGLLIFTPAAGAWLTGCIAGAALPTRVTRNVR